MRRAGRTQTGQPTVQAEGPAYSSTSSVSNLHNAGSNKRNAISDNFYLIFIVTNNREASFIKTTSSTISHYEDSTVLNDG